MLVGSKSVSSWFAALQAASVTTTGNPPVGLNAVAT
jgi:hypothetical protein